MDIAAFVILHYGDWNVTIDCVNSITTMQLKQWVRIVVVDNDDGNSEEEGSLLRQSGYENVTVLVNRGDHGFSYANNLGYRYAREELHAKYILVLNNDIVFPQKDFLKRLFFAYQRDSCHVLSPQILRGVFREPQSPLDIRLRTRNEATFTIFSNKIGLALFPVAYPVLALQEKISVKQQLKNRQANLEYYRKVQRQIVPFGACLIFTPIFVEAETAAFVPETSFYYEEYLLALRCFKNGYEIVYDPIMKVFHESGSATRQVYNKNREKLKFQMQHTLSSCRIYRQELKNGFHTAKEKTD